MSGLTTNQIEFFHDEGYLHLPDALGAADLNPVQDELEQIVDRAAALACWQKAVSTETMLSCPSHSA